MYIHMLLPRHPLKEKTEIELNNLNLIEAILPTYNPILWDSDCSVGLCIYFNKSHSIEVFNKKDIENIENALLSLKDIRKIKTYMYINTSKVVCTLTEKNITYYHLVSGLRIKVNKSI